MHTLVSLVCVNDRFHSNNCLPNTNNKDFS